MIKNLLIHIGYPKTATTTLQENLFYSLHQSGIINFLGRADFKEDSCITSTFEEIHGAALGARYLDTNSCLPRDERHAIEALNHDQKSFASMRNAPFADLLANDKLNVYSDEALLLPYRSLTGYRSLPSRLKSMFDDGNTKIQILVTVRSQASLMSSFFAEKYGYFRGLPDYETPTALFFRNGKLKPGEYSEIFDFDDIASTYAETFGKDNVHILVYEDIQNNKKGYIDTISRLLETDRTVCDDLFGKQHFRKKEKIGNHYAVRSTRYRALASMLSSHPENPFFSIAQRIISSSPALKSLGYKLFGNSQCNLPIPEMSCDERDTIFTHYKNTNQKLASDFGLDVNRLSDYGYF